jgi:hypothetical protein
MTDTIEATSSVGRAGGPDGSGSLSELAGQLMARAEAEGVTLVGPGGLLADLCRDVGGGDLESLLVRHEEELWPQIEELARSDVRFRRALSSVWAYDSPVFERRTVLLEELGEARTVAVRFVVEPRDFSDEPPLEWRAVDIEGRVSGHRLAEVLRGIADWLEQREARRDSY